MKIPIIHDSKRVEQWVHGYTIIYSPLNSSCKVFNDVFPVTNPYAIAVKIVCFSFPK